MAYNSQERVLTVRLLFVVSNYKLERDERNSTWACLKKMTVVNMATIKGAVIGKSFIGQLSEMYPPQEFQLDTSDEYVPKSSLHNNSYSCIKLPALCKFIVDSF